MASERSRWLWVCLASSVIALMMNASHLHEFQTADSILPVLVSLQHWTPFYWGQDRYGMLVPLLAIPFRSPLANLVAQDSVNILFALMAPFVLSRFFDDRRWLVAGLVTNAILLTLQPRLQFEWLAKQPYAGSFTLAFGALAFAAVPSRIRLSIGTLVLMVAHWVNLAVCVVVIPCVLLRGRLVAKRLSMVAVAVAGGILVRDRFGVPQTVSGLMPVARWMGGWWDLLTHAWHDVRHPYLLAGVIVAAVIAIILDRNTRHGTLARAAILLAVAAVYLLFISTLDHVQSNDAEARYALPSIVLGAAAIATVLATLADRRPRLVIGLAACAFVAGLAFSFGLPQWTEPRRTLDRRMGLLTPDVFNTGATVIVGDYWTVWPAVFHANLVAYERDRTRPFFGLTYRSEPTDPIWLNRATKEPVVLMVPYSDPSSAGLIARLDRTASVIAFRGPFILCNVGDRRPPTEPSEADRSCVQALKGKEPASQ